MVRSHRFLLLLVLGCLLVPAGAASAATARFSAVFTATRSSESSQPRGVFLKDCSGEHYSFFNGSDDWKVETASFPVTVRQMGPLGVWTFGTPPKKASDARLFGVPASGSRTREWHKTTGQTGGWCGGASEDRSPKGDCGGRLPKWRVMFTALSGQMGFTLGTDPAAEHENFDFYKCPVLNPEDLYDGSFPDLKATYRAKDLFNKRVRTLSIGTSKDFGPTVVPVTNTTVSWTAKGTARWTLKLTRVKEPRRA